MTKFNNTIKNLIIDTSAAGSVTLSSSNISYWKLDETVVLTADRTITLDAISAKDNDEITTSLINIDFSTFKVTIQDSSGLMPILVVDTPSTFLFKFKTDKWNQII